MEACIYVHCTFEHIFIITAEIWTHLSVGSVNVFDVKLLLAGEVISL